MRRDNVVGLMPLLVVVTFNGDSQTIRGDLASAVADDATWWQVNQVLANHGEDGAWAGLPERALYRYTMALEECPKMAQSRALSYL
jgi:hypothetical protein